MAGLKPGWSEKVGGLSVRLATLSRKTAPSYKDTDKNHSRYLRSWERQDLHKGDG